jgi:hypothetical protein
MNNDRKITTEDIMTVEFLRSIEKQLLESSRFRKCDWKNIDGIDYLNMIDTLSIALFIRDVLKDNI